MKLYNFLSPISDIPLIFFDKEWKILLDSTGRKPESKLTRNHRLWNQTLYLFIPLFLFLVTCITANPFQDFIKEKAEAVVKSLRDLSQVGLRRLVYALLDN